MPSHEVVNGLGLTYKGTTGISMATIPDVCKTPSPAGPVPIPYPNIAQQSSLKGGTTTVFAKGKMIAIKGSQYGSSNGDEPGTAGGVKSSVNMKATDWITYSFDVKMDGSNACRHTDKKFHNNQNTVDLAGNLDPVMAVGDAGDKPLTIECHDAPKSKPKSEKYGKCEKEEFCAKCKAINDEMRGNPGGAPARTESGVQRVSKAEKAAARTDSLVPIANMRSDLKDGTQTRKYHDGISDDCKKELDAKGLDRFDVDHAVDLQIGGHPSSSANLRLMSNGPNRSMGSQLKGLSPGTGHTGVAPDCCAGGAN